MQHRRTRNLRVSVYILCINWYIQSDCEMWQHIATAEGGGARYRRNIHTVKNNNADFGYNKKQQFSDTHFPSRLEANHESSLIFKKQTNVEQK